MCDNLPLSYSNNRISVLYDFNLDLFQRGVLHFSFMATRWRGSYTPKIHQDTTEQTKILFVSVFFYLIFILDKQPYPTDF